MMTQAEQDLDLEDARAYLSCTSLTADRCRHASVTETTLWFFDAPGTDKKARRNQIGSASRVDVHDSGGHALRWEVHRMLNGQPTARCYAGSLLEAVTFIVRDTPQTMVA